MDSFTLLIITLLVLGILKLISLLNVFAYWKDKGIPYLSDSLSSQIIGWKVMMGYISFADFVKYMYNRFPNAKYIGWMDMATPAVVIRDPELIKDVMVKDFEYFPDHRMFIDDRVEPLFGKNTFSLRGDRWKEMRNTLSPSFTASKMKFMFDLISECSENFVGYLSEHPEICEEVEAKAIFRRYTNDVIATTAFGISVDSMKNPDNEFYRRGVEVSRFSTGLLATAKIVFLQSYSRLANFLGFTFFPRGTAEFFTNVVKETIAMREERKIVRPDMIHLLMQARDREDAVHKMTLEDIVSQAFSFFFAGFDTASTLMCFAAHELAVHQDIQDRLRREVEDHLVEGNGKLSYDLLMKMPYMDMVVSETLRKYPPVVLLDRRCSKRYELPPPQPGCKGVFVEPSQLVMFPVYGLQHDPKYFPNPDEFDPERFSEENKDNILTYAYLPFGHGPRKCLGNRFVLMEAKILIAHLLLKFTLKTTKKTVEPIVFSKKDFMLQPDGGFWINLEKREA